MLSYGENQISFNTLSEETENKVDIRGIESIDADENLYGVLSKSVDKYDNNLVPSFSERYRVQQKEFGETDTWKIYTDKTKGITLLNNGFLLLWCNNNGTKELTNSINMLNINTNEVIPQYLWLCHLITCAISEIHFIPENNMIIIVGDSYEKHIGYYGKVAIYKMVYPDHTLKEKEVKFSNIGAFLIGGSKLCVSQLTEKYFLLGSTKSIYVIDDKEFIYKNHNDCATCFSVSKNNWLALGDENHNSIRVYHYDKQGKLAFWKKWEAHKKRVNTLSILQNDFLASGGGSDHLFSNDSFIHIWNVADGTCVYDIPTNYTHINQLLTLPNGWLCSRSNGENVSIWNIKSKKEELKFLSRWITLTHDHQLGIIYNNTIRFLDVAINKVKRHLFANSHQFLPEFKLFPFLNQLKEQIEINFLYKSENNLINEREPEINKELQPFYPLENNFYNLYDDEESIASFLALLEHYDRINTDNKIADYINDCKRFFITLQHERNFLLENKRFTDGNFIEKLQYDSMLEKIDKKSLKDYKEIRDPLILLNKYLGNQTNQQCNSFSFSFSDIDHVKVESILNFFQDKKIKVNKLAFNFCQIGGDHFFVRFGRLSGVQHIATFLLKIPTLTELYLDHVGLDEVNDLSSLIKAINEREAPLLVLSIRGHSLLSEESLDALKKSIKKNQGRAILLGYDIPIEEKKLLPFYQHIEAIEDTINKKSSFTREEKDEIYRFLKQCLSNIANIFTIEEPSLKNNYEKIIKESGTLTNIQFHHHKAIQLSKELDNIKENDDHETFLKLIKPLLKFLEIDENLKGCDLSLISINDATKIDQLILNTAKKSKTPILIREKNRYVMYGDAKGNVIWDFTKITSDPSHLNDLPFDKGIIKRTDKQFTESLVTTLKEGHTHLKKPINHEGFAFSSTLIRLVKIFYKINEIIGENIKSDDCSDYPVDDAFKIGFTRTLENLYFAAKVVNSNTLKNIAINPLQKRERIISALREFVYDALQAIPAFGGLITSVFNLGSHAKHTVHLLENLKEVAHTYEGIKSTLELGETSFDPIANAFHKVEHFFSSKIDTYKMFENLDNSFTSFEDFNTKKTELAMKLFNLYENRIIRLDSKNAYIVGKMIAKHVLSGLNYNIFKGKKTGKNHEKENNKEDGHDGNHLPLSKSDFYDAALEWIINIPTEDNDKILSDRNKNPINFDLFCRAQNVVYKIEGKEVPVQFSWDHTSSIKINMHGDFAAYFSVDSNLSYPICGDQQVKARWALPKEVDCLSYLATNNGNYKRKYASPYVICNNNFTVDWKLKEEHFNHLVNNYSNCTFKTNSLEYLSIEDRLKKVEKTVDKLQEDVRHLSNKQNDFEKKIEKNFHSFKKDIKEDIEKYRAKEERNNKQRDKKIKDFEKSLRKKEPEQQITNKIINSDIGIIKRPVSAHKENISKNPYCFLASNESNKTRRKSTEIKVIGKPNLMHFK